MVFYEPLIIGISIAVIIELFILCRVIWKFCCDSKVKRIKCYYKFWTISFIICGFGCSSMDILHTCANQIQSSPFALDESDHNIISYFRLVADILYFLGTLILYLLFAGRLYLTFQGTQYQLKKLTLTVVIFIVSIATISEIFYIIFLVLQLLDVKLAESLLFYTMVIIAVSDIIMNVLFLSLFLRKLKHVVVCQSENKFAEDLLLSKDSVDSPSINSTDSYLVDLGVSQLKFINVMTKMTLLSGISMVIYEIHLFYLVSLFMWFSDESWAYIVGYSSRTFYILSATICIFLNFEINESIYHRICGRFHRKLYGVYVKDTKRRVRKSMSAYNLDSP